MKSSAAATGALALSRRAPDGDWRGVNKLLYPHWPLRPHVIPNRAAQDRTLLRQLHPPSGREQAIPGARLTPTPPGLPILRSRAVFPRLLASLRVHRTMEPSGA